MRLANQTRLVARRLPWLLAMALQGFCMGGAWAAPDDDFRRGELAFKRGDVATAMTILRAPADAGHGASQSLLAFILLNADFAEQAARLYQSAADQGDVDGHAGLANLLMTGRGIAKDEKKALVHFSKAADLGHVSSILALADAHLNGQLGLNQEPKDNAAAVAALRRAAEHGHLPSVQALADAYRVGGLGLAADAPQAAQWQAQVEQLRKQRGSTPTGRPSKTKP